MKAKRLSDTTLPLAFFLVALIVGIAYKAKTVIETPPTSHYDAFVIP